MKNKRFFVLTLAAFIILFAVAGLLYNSLKDKVDTERLLTYEQPETESTTAANEAEGTTEEDATEEDTAPSPAPNLLVYDLGGNAIRLSDYLGKPVVVNFWATWCGSCTKELPVFEEKYLEYGEDVQFLMVNLTNDSQETIDVVTGYIANNGYTFPVVYDKDSTATSLFGALYIPSTYFIDSEGYIRAQVSGTIDEGHLQKGIELIQ